MRILITADPYVPVPPVHYGGIERVIDMLVHELAARGHDVTLVAHPDSRTPARLIAYGRPPHAGRVARVLELAQVGGALWKAHADVDVIHSFGRLAALLPVLPLRRLPKIQSYQRDGVPWTSVGRAIRLAGRSLVFTGCSTSVYRNLGQHRAEAGEWRTIFNGVDSARYCAQPCVASDAPLVFLGRLDPIKGAHDAIAIARQAGRRLIIAGTKVTSGPDAGYFDRAIAPHVDEERVRFVGPVDDAAKNALLGSAAALLMPIGWEEPFGIVMAEAFACGTPVIAFSRGSVPEVIRDGVNGFACRSIDEAIDAVGAVARIDRRAVRADCDARFGAPVIADAYESLYHEMLEVAHPHTGAPRLRVS
jgi:glycosyltransferase involved in cell wall biosynthesis